MKKPTVNLSIEEVKDICKLGQGEKCCAFLTMGSSGFECCRMNASINSTIFSRLFKGTMNAKGIGGWEGCIWEKELKVDKNKN